MFLLNRIPLQYNPLNLLKNKLNDTIVNIKSQNKVLRHGKVEFKKMAFHYLRYNIYQKYLNFLLKQYHKLYYTKLKRENKNIKLNYQRKYQLKRRNIKRKEIRRFNIRKDRSNQLNLFKIENFNLILRSKITKKISNNLINNIKITDPNILLKKKKYKCLNYKKNIKYYMRERKRCIGLENQIKII